MLKKIFNKILIALNLKKKIGKLEGGDDNKSGKYTIMLRDHPLYPNKKVIIKAAPNKICNKHCTSCEEYKTCGGLCKLYESCIECPKYDECEKRRCQNLEDRS